MSKIPGAVQEIPGLEHVAGPLGFRVDRATENLPQGTDTSLFTITGGRVYVTAIIGEVTTVIQTQANATKLKFNPTPTGADQDLCAALDITADPVGEIYTIDGIVGNAMRSDLLIGQGMTNPLILSEGEVELDCAASNTGQVAWTIFYFPIDDGAVIAAS